jgi:hypothetical protein
MLNVIGNHEEYIPLFERARDFVVREYQSFVKNGDYKHAMRYARLRRYFDLRSEHWE